MNQHEPETIDLNQLATDLLPLLVHLAGAGVGIATDLVPGVNPVRAAPELVRQAVLHLAQNAIEAMPDGGTLTVRTRVVEDAHSAPHPDLPQGRYAALAVSDTGCGMTDDEKARIFEPFFTTKGHPRTGLSLAMVYGFARSHGGSVAVETAVGVGSTLEILLPAVEVADEPFVVRLPPPRGTETVLIAEPEELIRKFSGAVLEKCGYRVLDAEHAVGALDRSIACSGPIHLLLVGPLWEDGSARDLATALRAARPGLRVLYSTGYGDGREGDETWSGWDAVLQRPHTPTQLAFAVRAALDSTARG